MRTSEGERGSERVRAPSSTSRGAITRRPEGKPGMITSRPAMSCPPAGVCSGYARSTRWRFGPAAWSEQIRSISPASHHYCPTHDDIL